MNLGELMADVMASQLHQYNKEATFVNRVRVKVGLATMAISLKIIPKDFLTSLYGGFSGFSVDEPEDIDPYEFNK